MQPTSHRYLIDIFIEVAFDFYNRILWEESFGMLRLLYEEGGVAG